MKYLPEKNSVITSIVQPTIHLSQVICSKRRLNQGSSSLFHGTMVGLFFVLKKTELTLGNKSAPDLAEVLSQALYRVI